MAKSTEIGCMARDVAETPEYERLTLGKAAERLGVSRMRLRQAIAAGVIEAQRDNRGFWRVSLPADLVDTKSKLRTFAVPPSALIELLFDEIEELNFDIADRDATVESLGAVAARQHVMLQRTMDLAQTTAPPGPAMSDRLAGLNERSFKLLEETIGKLSDREADIVKFKGLLERALRRLSDFGGVVDRQTAEVERQRTALEHLFDLANSKLDALTSAAPHRRGPFSLWRGRDRGPKT